MSGVVWRPNERQILPIVQHALNRRIFKQVGSAWMKEVEVHHAYGGPLGAMGAAVPMYEKEWKGVRLDLCLFLKRGKGNKGQGFHVFEVKMWDDKDADRLARQLAYAERVANFVWLVTVGKDPTHADERIGLIRYDLEDDKVKVVRWPERISLPPFAYHLARQYAQWSTTADAALAYGDALEKRYTRERDRRSKMPEAA